jgi:hypothetical protein
MCWAYTRRGLIFGGLRYVRQQQEECPTFSQVKYCFESKTTLKTSDKELTALAKRNDHSVSLEMTECFAVKAKTEKC